MQTARPRRIERSASSTIGEDAESNLATHLKLAEFEQTGQLALQQERDWGTPRLANEDRLHTVKAGRVVGKDLLRRNEISNLRRSRTKAAFHRTHRLQELSLARKRDVNGSSAEKAAVAGANDQLGGGERGALEVGLVERAAVGAVREMCKQSALLHEARKPRPREAPHRLASR